MAALLSPDLVVAQDHVWSELIGGPGNTIANGVAADRSGNVVIAGDFDGDLRIGDTSLSTSAFTTDGLVAKFSASGSPLWAKQFGSTNGDSATAVTVADDGTVFAVGHYDKDVYLVAYKGSNGAVLWAEALGGASTDTGFGLVINSRGEVVIVAGLQGSGSFGGDVLKSAGSYDIVIAAYKAANGAHLWSRRYGAAGAELVGGVDIDDSDTLAIVGNISETTDLGTGPLQTNGLADIFIATYSALDGSPIWAKTFGGTGYDSGEGVAFDPQGNLLATGYFGLAGSGVDFGGGVIKSAGYADVFLAKFSSRGGLLWANGYGGIGDDYGRDVAVDRAGNATVTGHFQLTADFGGDPLVSKGQIDVFLAQYDANGKHRWSAGYGNLVTEKGLGVAVDPNDDVLVTGFTLWSMNLGGGMLFSAGYADAFLAKLAVDAGTPPPTPTPAPAPVGVSGQVRYFSNNEVVPGVDVLVETSNGSEWTQTNAQGNYSVTDLPEGTWTVEPVKMGDLGSAISSLDAAYALQAAVGMRELSAPESQACDVSGNGRVSSLDAADILSFVVGVASDFPVSQDCGSDWIFVPAPAPAANQSVALPEIGQQCVAGSITFDPLSTVVDGQDFLAVALGDCSGNWRSGSGAALVRTASSAPTASVRQLRRSRHGTARLPIIVRSEQPVHAIDVQLRYDPSVLELTGARLRNGGEDVLVSYNADEKGRTTLALASAQPLAAGKGTMLLLQFDVLDPAASRNAVEVIYVALDEMPAELMQRIASSARRHR